MVESALEKLHTCYDFQARYEGKVQAALNFLAGEIGCPDFGIVRG